MVAVARLRGAYEYFRCFDHPGVGGRASADSGGNTVDRYTGRSVRVVRARRSYPEGIPVKLGLDIGLLITSVLLVVLVLLHRGKGGGLSSLFGGGVQSSLSGSSVVERNLDRMTIFVGIIWVILIVGYGFYLKVH